MANLQNRLDEFKKTFESGGPPTTRRAKQSRRCIEPLPNSRRPGLKIARLKAGDRAPSFHACSIRITCRWPRTTFLREGPLVVSFFRGHW